MSLNHLSKMDDENKFLNIKLNDLSFGGVTRMKTKESTANYSLSGGNIVLASSPIYYTSDYNSVTYKGSLVYTSSASSQITFNVGFDIPIELRSRFANGAFPTSCNGNVAEHSLFPSGINNAVVSTCSINGNSMNMRVVYRQNQVQLDEFIINFECQVYNFNA